MPEIATPDDLARLFHETYERLAPEYGYRTCEASAVPWADVPTANKRLMTDVAGHVLEALATGAVDPAEPTTEQVEADIPAAEFIEDSAGSPWLVCRRCHEELEVIENGDWLETLVLTARQHTCPKPADTPEANRG